MEIYSPFLSARSRARLIQWMGPRGPGERHPADLRESDRAAARHAAHAHEGSSGLARDIVVKAETRIVSQGPRNRSAAIPGIERGRRAWSDGGGRLFQGGVAGVTSRKTNRPQARNQARQACRQLVVGRSGQIS